VTVPFFVPPVGEEEIEAAVAVLRSGWLTSGPEVAAFEAEFAAAIGGDGLEAVAVNSATAGLHLALEAIGIGPGDAVLVPTLTFTATAEVVRYLGADVILVDVEPNTLLIDLADAARRMTDRVKAIMPVHFGGLAMDREALLAFANAHQIAIVDDAAHALPSSDHGHVVGNWGTHATVFSFYANKTITTGEGGMVVTRDSAIARRIRLMRTHGMSRDAFDRFRVTGASWEYDVVAPGFKYNLTDLAAAIGRVQLRKREHLRLGREAAAKSYLKHLEGLPLGLPADASENSVHSWHLFPITVKHDAAVDRDALITHLSNAGIGTSVHYKPLHLMRYWKDACQVDSQSFPIADRHFATTVSLPIFPGMTEEQCEGVCAALRAVL
jgi:dTDP-4-amino-4,6-dideoxygalactose transaminase